MKHDLPAPLLLKIDKILLPPHPAIKSCTLENPDENHSRNTHTLQISGKITGHKSAIEAVDVMTNRQQLRRIPVSRADSSFDALLGTLGWQRWFEVQLHAVCGGKRHAAPFALLHGKRHGIETGFTPIIQPLLVTAWGRSGTTWMMHLLAQHPEIAFLREHPYESRPALYWMQMLRVLGAPPDAANSAGRDATAFGEHAEFIGANPFYDAPETNRPALRRWLGRDYIQNMAAFSQRNIEDYYRQVAQEINTESEPRYFAEKIVPDYAPWIFHELYPRAREIILVRDFRDVIASSLAFNAQRGTISFGRNKVKNDAEYIGLVAQRAQALLDAWKLRPATHLVRYEDLIQSPAATLETLLKYLELQSTPISRADILQRATKDTSDLQSHRTSASPQDSIGRYKHHLTSRLQAICARELGAILREFGYDT